MFDTRFATDEENEDVILEARAEEVYLYGDGRPTYHYGQPGDPDNGKRIYNSLEDDITHENDARLFRQLLARQVEEALNL